MLETLACLESERRTELTRLTERLQKEAIERQNAADALRDSREMLRTVNRKFSAFDFLERYRFVLRGL